jgi:hypothetical protein
MTQAGEGSSITYYAKNVTLSSADGSKKVVSTGAGLDKPAFVAYTADAAVLSRAVILNMAEETLE